MKRTFFLFFIFFIFFVINNNTYALVWGLEGIDIISRKERGADESWRWKYGGSYKWLLKDLEFYEDWLQGNRSDPGGRYQKKQKRQEKDSKRREYLMQRYPDDIAVDKVEDFFGEYELRRPLSFKYNKSKIIIHHTAGEYNFQNESEAMSGVRDIYKYHTITKGWGDIGYNFLIDKFGNIYEGRAGGSGVIGAHADRNNTKTIGIALMGNFENEIPSEEMWISLMKLIVALTKKYKIDADAKDVYFTALQERPWIQAQEKESIVGHRDTKNTLCPGIFVSSQIEKLRTAVSILQDTISLYKISGKNIHFLREENPFFLENEHESIRITLPLGGKIGTCHSLDRNIDIVSCDRDKQSTNTDLILNIKKQKNVGSSGRVFFLIQLGNQRYIIQTTLMRYNDIEALRLKKQADRGKRHKKDLEIQKVHEKISIQDAISLMKQDISVLLYDLTSQYKRRNISCIGYDKEKQGCDLILDGSRRKNANIINIVSGNENLYVYLDLRKYNAKQVKIIPHEGGLIRVDNYNRSRGERKFNIFQGSLEIKPGTYKDLQSGRATGYLVVNTLPFFQYIQGIGETSEQQNIEKIRVMALLAKGYTLFYMNGKNLHPSIPKNASYQAVDDPRIFQKYLGYAFREYAKKWQKAVEETKYEFIIYKDFLPILPYFHCSAGFTKSAKDAFGRIDTPWLTSRLDFSTCPSGKFEGHGVGLSGDGSQYLAEKGVKYHEIIERYYPGTHIKTLQRE